jgi:hypothetical protein
MLCQLVIKETELPQFTVLQISNNYVYRLFYFSKFTCRWQNQLTDFIRFSEQRTNTFLKIIKYVSS